jgi:hypothetical protein
MGVMRQQAAEALTLLASPGERSERNQEKKDSPDLEGSLSTIIL